MFPGLVCAPRCRIGLSSVAVFVPMLWPVVGATEALATALLVSPVLKGIFNDRSLVLTPSTAVTRGKSRFPTTRERWCFKPCVALYRYTFS